MCSGCLAAGACFPVWPHTIGESADYGQGLLESLLSKHTEPPGEDSPLSTRQNGGLPVSRPVG